MTKPLQLKSNELKQQGHIAFSLELPAIWKEWAKEGAYEKIDQDVFRLTAPHGELFVKLQEFASFHHIEHITSYRCAPDDEGIWHDDGSRPLAFSLGLNLSTENIRGGELLFRRKGEDDSQTLSLPPFKWGQGVVFLTGLWGYEHRVCRVKEGQRLVVAGWCTL